MLGRPAVATYRGAARLAARALARDPLVEAVWLRRGVAAGEVDFGRSDIDLGILIGDAASSDREAAGLLRLARRVRALRVAVPVLGESLVHSRADLQRWLVTDPFRASVDRRSVRGLAGAPPAIPETAIEPRYAARRLAFWLESYLPRALRRGDVRGLRQRALDAWTAEAVISGEVDEPWTTRRAAAAALPHPLPADAPGLLASYFASAARVREALLGPTRPPRETLIFAARLPPTFSLRTFVVLPSPTTPPPAPARRADAFVCTADALALYVHHVNPFAAWELARWLDELEIEPPTAADFLGGCRFYGAPHWLRSPGFYRRGGIALAQPAGVVAHAARHLSGPGPPPPPPRDTVVAIPGDGLTCRAWYRERYASAARASAEAWVVLDAVSAASRRSAIRAQS